MQVDFDDLPALSLFARVVELRSFTAAAREAGLAKGAVSQRVARLERRLGVQLLRRSTRKLSLTDDGVLLFEHAARLVDIARAANGALAAGASPRGTVRLNAPATIHRGRLAEALRTFLERHPAVALSVTLDDRLVDLVEGDFDVLIRVIDARRRTSVARKLAADRVVVVGAPKYLASSAPLASPYDLTQHQCLRNSAIPERIDWRLGERGRHYTVPIRSRFESDDFALLHQAALAGMGLFVTLSMTVVDDVAAGRLQRVLEAYTGESLGIYAMIAERARPAPAARALIEHLARALRPEARSSRDAE
jgi:DNA-binding transcriptional LysR family regulator